MPSNIQDSNLLRDYQELQLRVMRSSHIEQQLRIVQDRLDHELILYKRLSAYSSKAVNTSSVDELLRLSVEAMVDVLEIESSAILICRENKEPIFHHEGLPLSRVSEEDFCADFRQISQVVPRSKAVILPSRKLQLMTVLQAYTDCLFYATVDQKLGIGIYVVGLISAEKSAFYEKLGEKHETIFNLFTQQLRSILTSRYQEEQIRQQLVRIERSEQELQKLSMIARKTKNAVLVIGSDHRIEWVNDSFSRTTGYVFEDVVGGRLREVMKKHEVDVEGRQQILEAVRQQQSCEVYATSRSINGEELCWNIEIIPVVNDAGKHLSNILMLNDVTAEVRFKEDLLTINYKYQLISQEAKVGIWEYSIADNYSQWNEVLIDMFGAHQKDGATGYYEFWESRIHPDDREYVINERRKVLNNEVKSVRKNYRIYNSDGEIRHLQSHTIGQYDEEGRLIGLMGSSIDVTELMQVDERVQSLKQFYENIVNHLPSNVMVFNGQHELVYANESMLHAHPFLQQELSKNIDSIIGINNATHAFLKRLRLHLSKAFVTQKVVSFNEVFILNHHQRNMIGTALPVGIGDSELLTIVSFTDVTELNRFQKELVRKNTELQKVNAELDNFVYRVSHDLRSPLLSIEGILGLMEDDDLDPEVREYHKLIRTSVGRMDSSIKDILEYSRNSRVELKIERFNIKKMVEAIFADHKFYGGNPMELQFTPECDSYLESDKTRINTLFRNLIGNAVKYRRNVPDSFVRFGMSTHKKQVVITLTDNGKGIEKMKIKKVFDMFYRGSSDSVGSGLGLYICKEIITKLQGKISLTSEVGQGTMVTITLPLKPKLK